jgi:hypothetical protein
MTATIQSARFWHPSGMRFDLSGVPGVSLRSTPGYGLRSLRDEIPSAAERVETFHVAGHYLRSLCEGIPNPEGCQNVAGGRSIAQTSGHRITQDPHPGGVPERRLFMTFPIQAAGFWHPSGMRFDLSGVPGVSLRSSPGYGLRSLRDEIPSAAERVETFHGGCHYLRSLCEGIPNPEGCQNVAGGRSIAQTSGHRITQDPHPGGVPERRLFMTFPIQAARFWHPSGMRFDSCGVPGVSLCSTPGYGLRSLWDEIPSAAERVETFHGGCHCLLSLRDECIPAGPRMVDLVVADNWNPDCRRVAGQVGRGCDGWESRVCRFPRLVGRGVGVSAREEA